jgi:hypothetical protein
MISPVSASWNQAVFISSVWTDLTSIGGSSGAPVA